ncbi:cAMP-binding domain of CRP or a regulatory subunit of cAMP-dependent protein kinases [Desulfatibacillum alkenivorans DSM 16219]|jgi:CRP-like cAMP-binding protein|uniref:cAMP-binding domain of CRP or a regulatory subunit of cAMP-dependent protein kinases n=1 Tax=Desulfatibacillum alkenivorans DSM 16219 TaxID=1121393 RepID=A0A1M7AV08_9BACT|nr:Crp/Fnr family transcriptional regulator [Desulfatibacillum alkenivorans]SHL46570.1 cAMP-binding domain of CRP or a regulatory subunit of cAMP-dependent protein kinases [Desulfatibacillum alkenivorans DSM 16219]
MAADLEAVRKALGFDSLAPDSEWEKLLALSAPLHVPKNGFFIKAGEKPHLVGAVVSGLFRTYCITDKGDERILAFRHIGHLLGGYAPYLLGRNNWYSIQALEDSELLCFSFKNLESLAEGHPCWKNIMSDYTVRMFLEKECRERSLLMDDAAARYLDFLEAHPGLEDRVSQYHIASYLGISPVSLSRIRSALKKVQ